MKDHITRFTLKLNNGKTYSIHAIEEKTAFKNIIAHSEPNYNPDWGYTLISAERV